MTKKNRKRGVLVDKLPKKHNIISRKTKVKPRKSYQENSELINKERRLRPIIRVVMRVIFSIIIIASIVTLVITKNNGSLQELSNDIQNKLVETTSYMGLNLQEVNYSGLYNLSEDALYHAMSFAKNKEGKIPLFSIDLVEAKKQLESFGWIKTAKIERSFPDAINITITERTPKAIWQYQREEYLIDENGVVIADDNLALFKDLPITIGDDANRLFSNIYSFISIDEELFSNISVITRISNRRWNVLLHNDILIKLPEDNPASAWYKLIEMHQDKKILDREIKSIDLRVEDRVFLK